MARNSLFTGSLLPSHLAKDRIVVVQIVKRLVILCWKRGLVELLKISDSSVLEKGFCCCLLGWLRFVGEEVRQYR